MKRIIWLIICVSICCLLKAQNKIDYGDLSFTLPSYVARIENDSYYVDANVTCSINNVPIENYMSMKDRLVPYSIREIIQSKGFVNRDLILLEYDNDKTFVLKDFAPMSDVLDYSYRYILLKGKRIGECYAIGCNEGGILTESFSYIAKFVYENNIYTLSLRSSFPAKEINEDYDSFADLLFNNGEYWFFTSREADDEFNKLILNSDKRLPQRYLELNAAFQYVLNTIYVKDTQLLLENPALTNPITVGIINDDNLRIRSKPVNGDIIGHFNKNEKIIIDGRTSVRYEIDGFNDYWYRVIYNKEYGWVYGGYADLETFDKEKILVIE